MAYEEDYRGGLKFYVDHFNIEQNNDLVQIGFGVFGITSGFCYWAYSTSEEAEAKVRDMNKIMEKKRALQDFMSELE